MTIQSLYSFYDGYLRTTNNQSSPNYLYSATLAQKVNEVDTFWKSQEFLKLKKAESFKKAGNEYAKNNQYKKAVELYKKSIEVKPDYTDSYYNLARTYKTLGDSNNAIETYKTLLTISPNDIEAVTNIADCYKDLENYPEAANYYKKALTIDPKYDIASRSIREMEHLELKKQDPELARQKRDEFAQKNLRDALGLVMLHAPQRYTSDLYDVKFMFDTTDALGGHQNIAQYENDKRRIVVTDKYIWAAPEVIAAYLVHEAVHAKDKDPYSSIKEEQDAYTEAVEFWIAHSNGIKDPEMDFAAQLYKESPQSLNEKVAEVYGSRDGSMPLYSPNHGQAQAGIGMILLDKIKGWAAATGLSHNNTSYQVVSDYSLLKNAYR